MTIGQLALEDGFTLPLQVLQSARGFYIGTQTDEEGPFSRESAEYWPNNGEAIAALASGNWTQNQL